METTSLQKNSPGLAGGSLTPPEKFVYFFSDQETDGNASFKNLLGGKGANLAEMTSLKIPVPPGFTISTEICTHFYQIGGQLPEWVKPAVIQALKKVESRMGKKFGDISDPLLVSVRSGARASMPGMMDTILNLGLNDETVEGLASKSGNARFAWDSYRRFIQMYSDVVLNINGSLFEVAIEDLKEDKKYHSDTEMSEADLKSLVQKFKNIVSSMSGRAFPTDPMAQLWGAIHAVFKSWNTARAITYRDLHGIPASWGTAVNVQAMVFGNRGDDCATGVAFTRNPSTGEKKFYGEFLVNAQGEDVVAGVRTPVPIDQMEKVLPQAYQELVEIYQKLEKHYKDIQDIEFTVEKGKLWMLQTRNGKRTAKAALRIACEMMDEKLITENEAILRIDPASLDQLLHPRLDPDASKTVLAKGLPASPGGVSGQIVFESEDAVKWKELGKKVILVRVETSPEDIAGMVAAQGILTTRGGMTSHAAVVARGMGKCCVAGCGEIFVDEKLKTLKAKGYVLKEGDVITLDGSTGEVFLGEVKTLPPELSDSFDRIMALADRKRKLKIRTNADTPKDAQQARKFGAEGIGLCRTEHMFFGADRIDAVREMIVADSTSDREKALQKLLPMQRQDFYEIFKIMQGYPVTIRLLDPPLHEFVPHTDEEIKSLSERIKVEFNQLRAQIKSLHEFNPMLGHRGCRLAITYPEIYKMQVQAIAEAVVLLTKEGVKVEPEIMIPLVGVERELQILREQADAVVKDVQVKSKNYFSYTIGTMIELPRAAVTADLIADHADFFSFGTNDLTQTTLGLSRDDSGRFLGSYVNQGIFAKDPFVSIDQKGVGLLVKTAVDLGRKTKPDLKMGVCGEHGGDPDSIEFFHRVGLNYVSCSPFRVPIARLAAARAELLSPAK